MNCTSPFFILVLALAIVTVSGNMLYADNMHRVRAEGWKIIDTKSSILVLEGESPYSNLSRRVLVEEYIVEKSKSRYRCTLTYDSQKDTFSEDCAALR